MTTNDDTNPEAELRARLDAAIRGLTQPQRGALGAAAQAWWFHLGADPATIGDPDENPQRALFWFDLAQTFFGCDAMFLIEATKAYISDRPHKMPDLVGVSAPGEQFNPLDLEHRDDSEFWSPGDALHQAIEHMGDTYAIQLGRVMTAKACDPGTPPQEVPFWHVLGTIVLDVAEHQRRQFEALRKMIEDDGDAEGEIVDGG